jgi:hypothetical protein
MKLYVRLFGSTDLSCWTLSLLATMPCCRIFTSTSSAISPRGSAERDVPAHCTLFQDHPERLSPAQMRHLLGVDKDLRATMKAMASNGLLRRVEGAGMQ